MQLADSTAGAVAQRHSGGPAVTAAMDEMAFLHPVHVGDIVRATPRSTGPAGTSMEIGVRVETEPWNEAAGEPRARRVGVLRVRRDRRGGPPARRSRRWTPETPDEVRRMREAEIRRAHRLAKKQEIDGGSGRPGAP